MMLMNGTIVVDISFVDFVIDLDSINTIEHVGDPVIFLGYESEPFYVAKSMVMLLCQ